MNYKRKAILGAIGMAVIMSVMAFCYTGVVLLKGPLGEIHGYTDGQFSIFFSTYCAGSMVGNFIIGKIISKIGFKKLIIFGSIGPVIGFTGLALIKSVFVLWIIGFFLGFMIALPSFVSNGIFISSWFGKGRATMMSLGSTMMNAVSIIITPVVAILVSKHGAVNMTLASGICITVLALLSAVFLVCELPDVYGAEPVDIGKDKSTKKNTSSTPSESEVYEPKMPTSKLLSMPTTIMCITAPALLSVSLTMLATNSVQIFQEFGVSYVEASYCISIRSISGVILLPIFGVLCDKIGSKKVMITFTAVCCASMFGGPALTGMTGAIILALFMNITQFNSLYSGLAIPPMYGNKRAPELMGYAGTIMGFAGVIAAPLASVIYNITGSWKGVLPIAGIIYVIVIVFMVISLSEKTKELIRKKDIPYLDSFQQTE